jgi:hypothetical protein
MLKNDVMVLKPMKLGSSMLLILLLLSSCISAQRNEQGEYEYWYCVSASGTPSRIALSDTLVYPTHAYNVKGEVLEIQSGKPIIAGLAFHNKQNGNNTMVYSDSLGQFRVKLQPAEYTLKVAFLGYNPADTTIIIKQGSSLNMLAKLGVGSGFYTMDIRSKRKLTMWQLRRRAEKLLILNHEE